MSSNCKRSKRRPSGFALLLALVSLAFHGGVLRNRAAAELPVIDVSVAGFYVGREVTVEAVVQAARRQGNVVRLELGFPPHTLHVSLVEGLLSRFPNNVEEAYRGKTVRVSGLLREFRGKIEMIVREPENLVVVAAKAPPAPAQEPLGRGEEQRIRVLEERLEALESRSPSNVSVRPSVSSGSEPAPDSAEREARLQAIEERLRKLEFRVRQIEQRHAPREE